jgi:uncharacterized protein
MRDMEISGVGLGLRGALVEPLLALAPEDASCIRWLECHPENYLRRGGVHAAALRRCRERWPIVTHGLTLSLGGVEPLDRAYLRDVGGLIAELGAPWHSDHLCFGGARGIQAHELLPLPLNEDTAAHLARRIREAQDQLACRLAIENITYYAAPPGSDLDEGDFVAAVVRESGCALLLDVNNVFVNAVNHRYEPHAVIAKMPLSAVVEIHVAGHLRDDHMLVDTHAEPLSRDVLDLLQWTLSRTGRVPILLERDGQFPPLQELLGEARALTALWNAA